MVDELKKSAEYQPGKLVIAHDLNEAAADEVGCLDQEGRVVDVRSSKWGPYITNSVVVISVAACALYSGVLGVLFMAGFFGLLWTVWLGPASKLRKGVRAMIDGHFDAALALLRKAKRNPLTLRSLRAGATSALGACLWCKGDGEAALRQFRAATSMYGGVGRSPNVYVRVTMCLEVQLLVDLDRLAEARARLDELLVLDEKGEYLRVETWTSQLYVCMAEGRHALADDELHNRTKTALRITNSAPLLGLLSWAHHLSQDDEQAWHLLREAHDREWPFILRHGFVRLRAWMQQHTEDAGVSAK